MRRRVAPKLSPRHLRYFGAGCRRTGDGTIDVSPRSVRKLIGELDEKERKESFSSIPAISPLSDILLDAWSLDQCKQNARPPGGCELSARSDKRPAYHICRLAGGTLSLSKYNVNKKTLQEWFQACPVRANERLQMQTFDLRRESVKLLKKHRQNTESKDFEVVLLDERNQAEWSLLSELDNRTLTLSTRQLSCPRKRADLDNTEFSILQYWTTPKMSPTLTLRGFNECGGIARPEYKVLLFLSLGLATPGRNAERVPLTSDEDLETDESVEGNAVELVLRMPEKELAISSPANAKCAKH